ncbi:MAG: hypothetical protein WBD56_09685 [Anaerolineales bacterium]
MSDFDLALFRNAIIDFTAQGRKALLPALRATQNLYGYLPEEAAIEVVRTLNMLQG